MELIAYLEREMKQKLPLCSVQDFLGRICSTLASSCVQKSSFEVSVQYSFTRDIMQVALDTIFTGNRI